MNSEPSTDRDTNEGCCYRASDREVRADVWEIIDWCPVGSFQDEPGQGQAGDCGKKGQDARQRAQAEYTLFPALVVGHGFGDGGFEEVCRYVGRPWAFASVSGGVEIRHLVRCITESISSRERVSVDGRGWSPVVCSGCSTMLVKQVGLTSAVPQLSCHTEWLLDT